MIKRTPLQGNYASWFIYFYFFRGFKAEVGYKCDLAFLDTSYIVPELMY
jgi:hypothetical protein